MENAMLATLRQLPHKLGAEIVRYSLQRFREQGWDGTPWQKRNPKAKRNTGRAILVDRGRLRRSIRIIDTTPTSVTVGSNVPYAQAHNEGFNGTVSIKAHTRHIKYRYKYTDLNAPLKARKDGTKRYKVRQKTDTYQTKVKAFTRRMRTPRRQFLGDSPYMRRNLLRITTAEFTRTLKLYMNITP